MKRLQSLTKANFWDELEAKYPIGMKAFKDWIDKYKKENEWNELFNDFPAGTSTDCDIEFVAPKYHEVPLAFQIGIFIEFVCELQIVRPMFIAMSIDNHKAVISDWIAVIDLELKSKADIK